MGSARPGWVVASAIYSGIMGVLSVLSGLLIVVFAATAQDLLQTFIGGLLGLDGVVSSILVVALMIGLLNISLGVFRIIVAYNLNALQGWARNAALALHILSSLLLLGSAISMLVGEQQFSAIVPLIFFVAETLLAIGLLMNSTTQAFQNAGVGAHPGQATQMAPANHYHNQYQQQQQQNPAFGSPQGSPQGQALPPTEGIPSSNSVPAIGPTSSMTGGSASTAVAPQTSGGNYGRPGQANVAKTELANAEPPVLAWLIERNGPRAGREHRMREEVTIGRDPSRCEIVLDDSKVSGEHARIRMEQGRYVIYDLASRNHTFVNGQEVQKQVLSDGDQIQFGSHALTAFMLAGK